MPLVRQILYYHNRIFEFLISLFLGTWRCLQLECLKEPFNLNDESAETMTLIFYEAYTGIQDGTARTSLRLACQNVSKYLPNKPKFGALRVPNDPPFIDLWTISLSTSFQVCTRWRRSCHTIWRSYHWLSIIIDIFSSALRHCLIVQIPYRWILAVESAVFTWRRMDSLCRSWSSTTYTG